jgi:hypothetical protein
MKKIPDISDATIKIILGKNPNSNIEPAINKWLNDIAKVGFPRNQETCKIIGHELRRNKKLVDYVLRGYIKQATLDNYSQGAQRAYYWNKNWTARAFHSPDKGGLDPLPWSNKSGIPSIEEQPQKLNIDSSDLELVNTWPWKILVNAESLLQWLVGNSTDWLEAKETEKIPRAIISMIETLREEKISRIWAYCLDNATAEPIPVNLIGNTLLKLLENGYRTYFARTMVLAFVAAYLNKKNDLDLNLNAQVDKLSWAVALAILGGAAGKPNFETVKWMAEHSISNENYVASNNFLTMLDAAKAGNIKAKREVVYFAMPFWQKLISQGILINWDQCIDILGFPFEYASSLGNDPNIMAIRAELLYVNGHSGDEDGAVRLAVEAGFAGSKAAWVMLNKWRTYGDESRVLKALLSLGTRVRQLIPVFATFAPSSSI